MYALANHLIQQYLTRKTKQLVKNSMYLSRFRLLQTQFNLIPWTESHSWWGHSKLFQKLVLGLDSYVSIRCQSRAAVHLEQYLFLKEKKHESSTSTPKLLCRWSRHSVCTGEIPEKMIPHYKEKMLLSSSHMEWFLILANQDLLFYAVYKNFAYTRSWLLNICLILKTLWSMSLIKKLLI